MTDAYPLYVDPIRLLPSERPAAFDRLPEEERAWRGRYYLMVWSLGGSEAFAWDNALNDSEIDDIKTIVSKVDDAVIVMNVRARQREIAGDRPPE